MHALGQSVAIVYECGYVLAAHVPIMYTLQICLIRTNLKALSEGAIFRGVDFHRWVSS